MKSYQEFLAAKAQLGDDSGFSPSSLPDFLFPFQASLVEWGLRKGRAAHFADCGLGKSAMQLVWADQVVRRENRPALILTPLAVSSQTVREAEKFGIEAHLAREGKIRGAAIHVANYEKLHLFSPSDFGAVVCDESSILKNFDGSTKAAVTEFMRTIPFRLLATATASPNDTIELGTSSEALGILGYVDMLGRFFKNDQNTVRPVVYRNKGQNHAQSAERAKWRFKHHAEVPFWRWVASWARAIRRPSDLGFEDGAFVLPGLTETEHVVAAARPRGGMLFDLPAVGLREQRDERRATIKERCERAAELCLGHDYSIAWCHLNAEGDLLEELIPDCVQVSGADSDDAKEEKLLAFARGEVKRLVSKPVVAGFGLNLQHCAHVVTFPSHSFESYYQSVRRCWRFGQKRPVTVDLVTTEGERGVMANLRRKADQADRMFTELVRHMNDAVRIENREEPGEPVRVPQWA